MGKSHWLSNVTHPAPAPPAEILSSELIRLTTFFSGLLRGGPTHTIDIPALPMHPTLLSYSNS